MSTVHATWKGGYVHLDSPVDWPEGHRLVVADACLPDVDFMSEDDQSADAAAIERWISEVQELPPLTMTAEQEADLIEWRKRTKEHNLNAMRSQMERDAT